MPTPEKSTPAALGSTRDVAREVLIYGPVSRRALSGRLGLSSASLTRLVTPLVDRGVLREGMHVTDGQVGRPTRPLDIIVESNSFVGVTVGRTEVRAQLTDFRANEVASVVVECDSADPPLVVDAVQKALEMLEPQGAGRSMPVTGVGVVVDGQVTDGTVIRSGALGWQDVPLGALLSDRLKPTVTVENDVVAMTCGENWFGAGRATSGFAVVSMRRTLGYGLVLGGRTITTADTGIGLGWHPTADAVANGAVKHSDSLLTAPGICAAVTQRLGRPVTPDEVLTLLDDAHPDAVEVVREATVAVGRMIGAVANFALVTTILLTGDGSRLVGHDLPALLRAAAALRHPAASALSVVVQRPGFDDAIRGAAAVAVQKSMDDGSFIR